MNDALKNAPKPRRCVDDLDDFEIKECVRIVNAAIKAQDPSYTATAAVMEVFYDHMFRDWTTDKAPVAVEQLAVLPDYESL